MLNLSHKKLDFYQISLNRVKEIYKATRQFPKEEQFVLISQIRRAAVSVACNIAEGASRISKPEKNDSTKYQEAQQLNWIHNSR